MYGGTPLLVCILAYGIFNTAEVTYQKGGSNSE